MPLGGSGGRSPPAIGWAALPGGTVHGARRVGPAVESMYRFVLWLVPAAEKFPRGQEFLLGDRLQATALDVLERIEATYTRDRRRHLAPANLGIETLRFLCRLAKDLGHLNGRCYEYAARALDQERGGPGRPRGYISFEVHAPKRRLISAAPFRDRMVHHALHAVIARLFEHGFIAHSYANRVVKGSTAPWCATNGCGARHRYVLRRRLPLLPAIDHEILKTDLRRRIRCRRTLAVLDRIVDRSNPREAGASALSERRPIPYGATGARPPRCACNR